MDKWYKLDNAAKLFPTVTSDKYSSVYRVSAVLGEEIDREVLQRAVDHISGRFPMLFLRLRKGVFWNYFDTNRNEFLVQEEKEYPCAAINPYENRGYLLRILYFGKRISVEVFHSLTDGGGALEFLKTLLYYYLCFQGNPMEDEGKILLAGDEVAAEEMEDSFSRYYEQGPPDTHSGKTAPQSFRIKGTPYDAYGNNVITGILSAKELIQVVKAENTTVTSYLASLLTQSIYEEQQRHSSDRGPIVITIPVNLRKLFPSRTLRNFFAVANVGINVNNETTHEHITRELTRQLKEKSGKTALQAAIAENVSLEKNLYSRFIPLPIKKNMIMIGSNVLGETRKTISISNLGNISVPTGFFPHVNHIEVTLYPTPKSPINCAVCSMGDKLAITFSRTIAETDIIRHFFRLLAETSAVHVEVYSNDWGVGA